MSGRRVLRVTLEYARIDYLFKTPDLSPFSDEFHEYSTRPGVEHIYNELRANPSRRRVEVTVLLPPDQITSTLEQRTMEAVRRYCAAREAEARQDERALRYRGLWALVTALVVLVAYVIVQRPLQNTDNFFVDLIGQGLGVVIWVVLWFPLDALVFGVRTYDLDSSAYRHVSKMKLKIEPAPR